MKKTQAARITEMLGGQRTLGHRIVQEGDLESAVRAGLPAQAVRKLAENTDTTLTALQGITHLDRSTFARRIRARAKLRPDESDRLARVARVATIAVEALGATDGIAWLHEANRALGGRAPFTMLDTDSGARQVEQILGRIEHGVFS